jgi:hypothetical protein
MIEIRSSRVSCRWQLMNRTYLLRLPYAFVREDRRASPIIPCHALSNNSLELRSHRLSLAGLQRTKWANLTRTCGFVTGPQAGRPFARERSGSTTVTYARTTRRSGRAHRNYDLQALALSKVPYSTGLLWYRSLVVLVRRGRGLNHS